jgi:hypothetical protein
MLLASDTPACGLKVSKLDGTNDLQEKLSTDGQYQNFQQYSSTDFVLMV